ncbi:MAG: hypothetical protein KKF52_03505, partial [Nanoarchaeota archaeon]|nr:hypothetical protein [Nanoarchaeota archaeon]
MNLSFLAPIVSFLGLIVGIFLSSITKDEIISGRKIFEFLRRISLTIIILIALALAVLNFNLIIILFAIILGLLLSRKLKNQKLSYLFLGLISASSLMTTKFMLLIISVLIFIYGLLYGALLKESKTEIIISNLLMFFLPFIILIMPFIGFG